MTRARYFPRLRSFRKRPAGKRQVGGQSRRLFLEPLEDRRLLAVTATLTNHVLSIVGDGSLDVAGLFNVAGDTYTLASGFPPSPTLTDNDGTLTGVVTGLNTVTF